MSYSNIGGDSKGEAPQDAEGGNSFLSSFGDRMKSLVPDNVNFDLLNPRSSQPLSERVFLAKEYTQPWSVFFSLGEFNLPPSIAEYKIRFRENIGLYFYNYFFIALVYLCLYTFLNFRSMLVVTAVLALLIVFYEIHPDDFEIGDSFRIGTNTKAVLSIIALVLAFIYGKLLILVGSFVFFLVVVVGVHATIREHAT